MNSIKAYIPNTITCLNLLSGALAVVFAFHSAETYGHLTGAQMAMIFIGVATVFDFLDGATARVLRAYSALGKELDSLSDLVSFGLAPAFLLFNALDTLAPSAPWLPYLALFIPVMGALRLARFNIDTRQSVTFIGLPIPANAIFWIGATAFLYDYYGDTIARPDGISVPAQLIVAALILLISLLMISGIRMFSLKAHNLSLRDNYKRIAIILAAIILVSIAGVPGLAWTMALYIGLCLILPAD